MKGEQVSRASKKSLAPILFAFCIIPAIPALKLAAFHRL